MKGAFFNSNYQTTVPIHSLSDIHKRVKERAVSKFSYFFIYSMYPRTNYPYRPPSIHRISNLFPIFSLLHPPTHNFLLSPRFLSRDFSLSKLWITGWNHIWDLLSKNFPTFLNSTIHLHLFTLTSLSFSQLIYRVCWDAEKWMLGLLSYFHVQYCQLWTLPYSALPWELHSSSFTLTCLSRSFWFYRTKPLWLAT